MFGANNRSAGNRPVSWALSDDILDRNIDQLDRETPRCNLSEEEEEELERSKLALEAQNAAQGQSSGIPKPWMAPKRAQDNANGQPGTGPVTSYQAPNITGATSPFMKRVTKAQPQGQSQEATMPVSTTTPTTTVTQSSAINRLGYTTSTPIQQAGNTPTTPRNTSTTPHNMQQIRPLHSTSHTPPIHPQVAAASRLPVSSSRSLTQVPNTTQAPNFSPSTIAPISKPMGLVSPQLPKQNGQPNVVPKQVVQPQVSSPPYGSSTGSSTPTSKTTPKQLSPTSLKKPTSQSAKSTTSQTATVAPQPKQQPQQQETPSSQQPNLPQQQQQQQQQRKLSQNAQNNAPLHLAYCHAPGCQGCRDAKKLKDDPAEKAKLIRKVEDEILLRSRELDSCWQEDELDCVRDFTDMDRRKEMTYAETSEEGIYKRVSDEIIKRPPIWHDDEVDSVKDYSERKGQEGETSKVGSEEKVCLSPPWNEEEEELLAREGVAMVHGIKPMTSSVQNPEPVTSAVTSIASEKPTAIVTFSNYKYYEEEADSVKNYAKYNDGQELGSRIPSSERISLTPPWTPSGCQTPAEGVPLPTKSPESPKENFPTSQATQQPAVNIPVAIEAASTATTTASVSKIDTSGVQLRNKPKRNRVGNCVPYVVPRFDDLEEDSVKDFSMPERTFQGLSSKIPSYEFIPFTPPWISHNNSGIQTPLEYSAELTSPTVPNHTAETMVTAASVSGPAMSTTAAATSQESHPRSPVLDSFRNTSHYDNMYAEPSSGVDSVKHFGLMEETSRIPSSEQLCFTPPWIEHEAEHNVTENTADQTQANESSQELTLEEQRAIEEEARKTGVQDAEAKALEQRQTQTAAAAGNTEQAGAVPGPPGRDSGFCSEQDQKQKQQQQQEMQNALIEGNLEKTDINQSNLQFQQDHEQCIISSANQDKDDETGTPDHCWSSKESSGSNQTDISTVVNPATSVPITAPGSPDPDGSEASDAEISENEAHNNESHDMGSKATYQGQGTKDTGSKVAVSVPHSEQLQSQSQVNNTVSQHPYLHHNQSYNYHQAQINHMPVRHNFPRGQVTGHTYHQPSYGPQSYPEQHMVSRQRPPGPYSNRPQNFPNELIRPKVQMPPYGGHYPGNDQIRGNDQVRGNDQDRENNPIRGSEQIRGSDQNRGQTRGHFEDKAGPVRGQVPSHMDLNMQGAPSMLYQPRHPGQHLQHGAMTQQMHMSRMHPQMHPPMSFHHRAQRPVYSQGQMSRGQMPQSQTSQGQMSQGQTPQGQMSQGQMSQSQRSQGQMPQGTGERPQGQFSQAEMSQQGKMQPSQMQQNQISQGKMPQGQLQQGKIPQNQWPQNQMLPGKIQQGQMPQAQVSQAQRSQAQRSQGPLPPSSYDEVTGHHRPDQQNHMSRQMQMDPFYGTNHPSMEDHFKTFQQGMLNIARMEREASDEFSRSQLQGPLRSISQINIQQNHDNQKNSDNASVVSFSSVAASHQNLDTKVDMVSSLLSMLGTHDKDDIARTLLAMSSSTDSCTAMRQSGCLPLLIKLLHDPEYEVKGINWEARHRAGLALHNIINSGTVDRKGRREARVLRLIEIVRAHSEAVLSGNLEKYQAHRGAPALRDHGPCPAVAALMKLSFEEEHKNTITELGGLQVIAELLQVDHKSNSQCKDPYSITLRKYAGMALINLTYSDVKNKNTLLEMKGALRAIVTGLASNEEEDLVQVSAGILRNVSWKSDENGKRTLAESSTARNLMTAVQHVRSEAAIRSILSAVWNLSAHSSDNKEEICSAPGSLKFLCYALNYRSPSRSLVIPENSGGIMRNISSHIAVKPEYRQILREHGCLKILISHLRSPSTRIVSNSCGILWNLSARSIEDQELLWELGAVSMLKTLVNSKHKSISTSSASALRNLLAVKPGSSSTDNESHASFNFKRANTLPGKARAVTSQNSGRTDRKYRSFFSKKTPTKDVQSSGNEGMNSLKKNASNRGIPNAEDSRKVHRKVKHGEPHYYADLYQDPPRRGITMPQTRDPTVVLYSSENPPNQNEGVDEDLAVQFNGNIVERWNNLNNGPGCKCKHGGLACQPGPGVDSLQQGMRKMAIEEESPIIARQRRGSSSSSLSSCSPHSQPHPANQQMPRINTDNSPLSIFKERRSNPGLSLHRRSMSDTISECGHPIQGPKAPHAVTDSELAKPVASEFNAATYRNNDHSSWYSLVQRQPLNAPSQGRENPRSNTTETYEMKDLRPQYRNLRMIRHYDEVAHYETHFLSPYDDCPLSVVKDTVRFPHFSLGYRPKQDFPLRQEANFPLRQEANFPPRQEANFPPRQEANFPPRQELTSKQDFPPRQDMTPPRNDAQQPPDPTTPKVFVQESRYEVRQAYHRRSNETIASSLQSSREELMRHSKHSHSGTNVWQCDLYENGNVWVRKGQSKGQEKQRSKGHKVKGPEGQSLLPANGYQNHIPESSSHQSLNCGHPRMGSRGTLVYDYENWHSKEFIPVREEEPRNNGFLGTENPFLGNEQRLAYQENMASNPQMQYGLAPPMKDFASGSQVAIPDIMNGAGAAQANQQSTSPDRERKSSDKNAEQKEAKKPLRSSLKSPSDGLKKFRKKHVTQKVVTSVAKKKGKGKDNVLQTSL